MDTKTGIGSSACNEVDNCLEGPKRSASPILGDVTKETMFNLVPLACPRREVAHTDYQSDVVSETLQLKLPYAGPITVAAARIGRDEKLCVRLRGSRVPKPFPAFLSAAIPGLHFGNHPPVPFFSYLPK